MTEGHFEVIKPNIEFNFRQKKQIQGHMGHDMSHVWPQGLWKKRKRSKIYNQRFQWRIVPLSA